MRTCQLSNAADRYDAFSIVEWLRGRGTLLRFLKPALADHELDFRGSRARGVEEGDLNLPQNSVACSDRSQVVSRPVRPAPLAGLKTSPDSVSDNQRFESPSP
jgi:hypothetical protein